MKQINEEIVKQILSMHNLYFLDKKKYLDFYHIFENSRYNIDVIWEENKIVAYSIIYNAIDCYELFEIAVDENYRNKGFANKLIDKLPSDMDIFLEVSENNINAIKLYKKNNFIELARRKKYYLDNSDAIVMRRFGSD